VWKFNALALVLGTVSRVVKPHAPWKFNDLALGAWHRFTFVESRMGEGIQYFGLWCLAPIRAPIREFCTIHPLEQ
jgi:hypothetical protein